MATPRLLSLDVFRGLTVAAMILVTDPGTYSAVYWPLRHAPWDGATPTDMIFPAFLFMAGLSIPLARAAHPPTIMKILRRGVLLFALGLLLNAVPEFHWATLRLPGILQRIAVCYIVCSFLYLSTQSRRLLAVIPAALLGVYWVLLKLVPIPVVGAGHLDTLNNLPSTIDRAILTPAHMWAYGTTPGHGVTFDPEGLLSTLPAIAATLIGVLAGQLLQASIPQARKCTILALAGVSFIATGFLLRPIIPFNKLLYTPTFALLSSGVSLLLFALLYLVVDIRRSRWWAQPALVFGANALFAFVLSTLITIFLSSVHIHDPALPRPISLHAFLYYHAFAPWLSPIHASLAYAIVIVLLNLVPLYPLYLKRVFVRL